MSSQYRLGLVWAFAALSFAAILYASYAGLNVGFRFDLQCDLRDFPNYYWAAQARDAGLNPFDIPALRAHFGSFVLWVYPEPLLNLFAPLARLDLALAGAVFTMIKIVVLGLAVVGWVRSFDELRNDWLFAVFILLGLNITLFHDVCGGNVAVFEAAAIAWAIRHLLLGRLTWFFVLIAVAGMWKIVPLGLVALAPMLYPRRRGAWIGVGLMIAIVLALLGLWWIVSPQEVQKWLLSGRGTFTVRINYFEGFKGLFWSNMRDVDSTPLHLRPEIYAFAAVFLAISITAFMAWRRSLAIATQAAQIWRLLLGVTAFVALMPGAFIYSFVFALPMIYLPLRRGLLLQNPLWLLALLGFALAVIPSIPWFYLAGGRLSTFQPLFAATIAWLLVLALRPRSAAPRSAAPRSAPMH